MRLIFLLCLIMSPSIVMAAGEGKVEVIAHRGASGHAPEHTTAAYQLALEQGADFLELDLQMTRDRKLVAIHDDRVDRTTNGRGKVASLTLEEIKKLDAGSWFNRRFPKKAQPHYHGLSIPTLEEVIREFGTSVNYYIEIKKLEPFPKMANELLKVLREYQLIGTRTEHGKVVVESFHAETLKYLRRKAPELVLIQLGEKTAKMNLAEISSYADGVGPNYLNMNKQFVKTAHRHGLLVHCWTVDNETDMIKLINWNVDGIFTNYVDRARKHIGALQ